MAESLICKNQKSPSPFFEIKIEKWKQKKWHDDSVCKMNMEKHSDSVSWKSAPIIVGGTGGSGTRGVVDVLDKLGIYMVK